MKTSLFLMMLATLLASTAPLSTGSELFFTINATDTIQMTEEQVFSEIVQTFASFKLARGVASTLPLVARSKAHTAATLSLLDELFPKSATGGRQITQERYRHNLMVTLAYLDYLDDQHRLPISLPKLDPYSLDSPPAYVWPEFLDQPEKKRSEISSQFFLDIKRLLE